MATKTEIICDGCGGDNTTLHTLGIDHLLYEFDFCSACWEAQKVPFVQMALIGRVIPKAKAGHHSRNGHPDASKIREWAQENGLEVSPKGRLKLETVTAYERAQ